jgi:hypothetical protein
MPVRNKKLMLIAEQYSGVVSYALQNNYIVEKLLV